MAGLAGDRPARDGLASMFAVLFLFAHFVFSVRESCLNSFYARAQHPALHKVQAMLHEGEAMFSSFDATEATCIVAFGSSWACARLTSVLGTSFLPNNTEFLEGNSRECNRGVKLTNHNAPKRR